MLEITDVFANEFYKNSRNYINCWRYYGYWSVIHRKYNGSTQLICILFFLISCEIIQPFTLMPNYETLRISYPVASFCFTALHFILAITIPELFAKIKISIV